MWIFGEGWLDIVCWFCMGWLWVLPGGVCLGFGMVELLLGKGGGKQWSLGYCMVSI